MNNGSLVASSKDIASTNNTLNNSMKPEGKRNSTDEGHYAT
jgi:hypothetical protein